MIEFSAHFRPPEPLGLLSLQRLSTRTGHRAKLPAAKRVARLWGRIWFW